jgi:hypothetical protein
MSASSIVIAVSVLAPSPLSVRVSIALLAVAIPAGSLRVEEVSKAGESCGHGLDTYAMILT